MDAGFELVAVAFTRNAAGRVRLLLAIDRDGEQLFGGEPALLAEHRPGAPAAEIVIEGADRIPESAFDVVQRATHDQLAALVDSCFDRSGQFDGQRMLGRGVTMRAASDVFDA